jgi:UDP-N-acetylmuramate-alanine ligase
LFFFAIFEFLVIYFVDLKMGNIVLVGAGGAGMSALAMIFHELGFENLVCIDSNASQITETLE